MRCPNDIIFESFCDDEAEVGTAFTGGRIVEVGCDPVPERLSAAGSMSGMISDEGMT